VGFENATYNQLKEMLELVDQLPTQELSYFYYWVNWEEYISQGGKDEPVDADECIRILKHSVGIY
jgi:hypothetical protein